MKVTRDMLLFYYIERERRRVCVCIFSRYDDFAYLLDSIVDF